VYVLVLLATLLVFGSVPDYRGRLPVIATALVFSVAGCAVFLITHGTGALYAATELAVAVLAQRGVQEGRRPKRRTRPGVVHPTPGLRLPVTDRGS